MRYFNTYRTKVGEICIAEEEGAIINLLFLTPPGEQKKTADERVARMMIGGICEKKETGLIRKAFGQLTEYFQGERQDFDLPLSPKGTEFQKKVWEALRQIPYGETRSYKQIAQSCGNEKACRAVGMANNRNPISIFIPCHRVIGANGKLVGYGGGLPVKELLLKLESTAPKKVKDKNKKSENRNGEKK